MAAAHARTDGTADGEDVPFEQDGGAGGWGHGVSRYDIRGRRVGR